MESPVSRQRLLSLKSQGCSNAVPHKSATLFYTFPYFYFPSPCILNLLLKTTKSRVCSTISESITTLSYFQHGSGIRFGCVHSLEFQNFFQRPQGLWMILLSQFKFSYLNALYVNAVGVYTDRDAINYFVAKFRYGSGISRLQQPSVKSHYRVVHLYSQQ